jgi:WD40 repeat protein
MTSQLRTNSWYYVRDKKKVGPVSLAQLRRLLAEGVLKPEDMILQAGSPKWRPLAEVVVVKPEVKQTGFLRKRALAIGAGAAAGVVLLTLSCCGLVALLTRPNPVDVHAVRPAAKKPHESGEKGGQPKAGDAQYPPGESPKGEPDLEFTSIKKEFDVPPRLVAQIGHSQRISQLALSNDGRSLATMAPGNTARLWDTENGKEINSIHQPGGLSALALAADGKRLATGSPDKIARLWDAVSGKLIRSFQGHTDSVSSVSLSEDGKWLVTGSLDKTARLWDVASGEQIRVFPGHGEVPGGKGFRGPGYVSVHIVFVSLSGDAKLMATMSHAREEYYLGGLGAFDRPLDLRVWDVPTGKVVHRFSHPKAALAIAMSADGKSVATGSSDKIARLWDVASGKVIMTFNGHANKVSSVALSRDGKWLATASWDNTARLWDTASGQEVRCFGNAKANYPAHIAAVAFSGDSKRFATNDPDQVVHVRDVVTGKEILSVRGFVEPFLTMGLSADMKWLATASADKTARLWDLSTGKVAQGFHVSEKPLAMVLAGDMKCLVTTGPDKSVGLRDMAANKEVQRFGGHVSALARIAHSMDGKWLVTVESSVAQFGKGKGKEKTEAKKTAHLWEIASGKKVRSLGGHPGPITSLIFSGDGKWLATGSTDETKFHPSGGGTATGTTRVWEFTSDKEVLCVADNLPLALSRDGKWLLTGKSGEATTRLWHVALGKERYSLQGYCSAAVFSNNGQWLATGIGTSVHLWDVASGKELRSFPGHFGTISFLAFSEDRQRLVSGSPDGTVRLWEVASGKELCRLINFKKGDWAVVDSQGRFDAANGGDVDGLHWVVGTEVIALKQLKERYYDPGLLAKHMGFNKEPLRNVKAFKDVKLFAEVTVANAKDPVSTKLDLDLVNRGGGIGRVQVFVNGVELLADARGPKFQPGKAKARLTVDLADAPTLRPGQMNKITVVTWNQEGYLSSRGLDLDWNAPGKKEDHGIELYAIVGGISDYAGPALRLRYAAKDAEDMAQAIALGAKRLFGTDKVHVTLLSTSARPGALAPTRTNFEKAFADVSKKARPGDVLFVYLAGHGVSLAAGNDQYCYLTREARTADAAALADPALMAQTTITSTELTEWVKKIPALKQVLVLDTCAAGAAAGKLTEVRQVTGDQVRAIERLKDRTGFHVLMGCAAGKVSYEATPFEQGLLTHALLKGMRGAALQKEEFLDVSKLFQYAADEVQELARGIGGGQNPLIAPPHGTSFDVGQFTKDDRAAVPLKQIKQIVLRPVLQNSDKGFDDLDLMPELRKRLANGAGTGPGSGIVFVDAEEMPGAVRPSGFYTVVNGKVEIRLRLIRDGVPLHKEPLRVQGTVADRDTLVDRLVEALSREARSSLTK